MVSPQETPAVEQSAPAVQPETPVAASTDAPVENQAQAQEAPATQENKGSLKDTFNSGVEKAKDAGKSAVE